MLVKQNGTLRLFLALGKFKPMKKTRCRFHQRFSRAFFARVFYPNVFFLVKLCFAHEKGVQKMLVKSTPGVNFIDVLCTVFMLVDPKRAKITVMS